MQRTYIVVSYRNVFTSAIIHGLRVSARYFKSPLSNFAAVRPSGNRADVCGRIHGHE